MVKKRKGQSTLEYALIIAVVVAAFLAMQHYMRRGVEGKLRESIDDMGQGGQYAAGNVTSNVTTTQIGNFSTTEANEYGKTTVTYVDVPKNITVSATGVGAEVINTGFDNEHLWNNTP